VTPKISIPVGFVFYQPAPELSAWYKKEKGVAGAIKSRLFKIALNINKLWFYAQR